MAIRINQTGQEMFTNEIGSVEKHVDTAFGPNKPMPNSRIRFQNAFEGCFLGSLNMYTRPLFVSICDGDCLMSDALSPIS
jgi:hypothetical protein